MNCKLKIMHKFSVLVALNGVIAEKIVLFLPFVIHLHPNTISVNVVECNIGRLLNEILEGSLFNRQDNNGSRNGYRSPSDNSIGDNF